MQHRAEKITDRMIFWRNCSDLLFKDCSAGLVASLRSSSLLSWTFQRQSKRSSPKQPRLLSTAPAPIYCVWTLSYAPIIVGLYKVRLYSSSDRTLRLCYEPGDIFVSINDILFVNFNLILLESWDISFLYRHQLTLAATKQVRCGVTVLDQRLRLVCYRLSDEQQMLLSVHTRGCTKCMLF